MSRLNVFKYRMKSWSRPINWVPNILTFFKNFKYAYDRAVKGYCEFDLWELRSFYQELFHDTIDAFANSDLYGAPMEFYNELDVSIEPWVSYLKEMAQHFYNSIEENEAQINEYDPRVERGLFQRARTPEEEELRQKWLKREMEIMTWRDSEFHKAMDMFILHFYDLWD